ncbi:hypothetical protein Dimus_025852 [Dionaea muscipula]
MASSDNLAFCHKILALFTVATFFSNKGTVSRVLRVDQEAEDIVEYACKHTLYYDLCESSLRSDPRSKTSDLTGLAGVALDLCIVQGREMLYQIQKLKSEG